MITIMTKTFTLKPQYKDNPYIKNMFESENLNKMLGVTASKSADEILEYIRKRKKQIQQAVSLDRIDIFALNRVFDRKKYKEVEKRITEGEAVVKEMENLEDFITDYYQRVVSSDWGKQFLEQGK